MLQGKWALFHILLASKRHPKKASCFYNSLYTHLSSTPVYHHHSLHIPRLCLDSSKSMLWSASAENLSFLNLFIPIWYLSIQHSNARFFYQEKIPTELPQYIIIHIFHTLLKSSLALHAHRLHFILLSLVFMFPHRNMMKAHEDSFQRKMCMKS